MMRWAALVYSVLSLAASVDQFIVGDTYSCFTGFQSVETHGCSSRIEDDNGGILQTAKTDSDTDFCVSQLKYGKADQGSFGKSKNYAVSGTLKMTDMGKFSTSYGYLGIAFNMMDSKNYDIAYVRPHAKDHCWEIGYVEDGLLFGRDFGACNGPVSKEFNIAVTIENGKGSLYVNGGKEADFNPFFPPVNKVATAMRNNMEAKMLVNSLKLCQEIKCVSKNAEGKIEITSPGDSYQDASMSKCEACVCGLYGQIRCGCLPAAEQGVVCGGGMIAAVGKDCCARCVPPKGYCKGYGDPHYTTFDGKGFLYQGDCTYCLMKTNDFEVRVKNQDRGPVSITEYCQLLFDGDMYKVGHGTLQLMEAGQSAFKSVITPFKKHYTTTDYVYCTSYDKCKIFIGGQEMLDLYCKFYYFTIGLHGTYYERTDCICGSWDGNSHNDWTDKNGNLVNNQNSFANSYQVQNNDGCPQPPDPEDPCDTASRETKNFAEVFCSRYKQQPFKQCHQYVDVTKFFKDCMYDYCAMPGDTENICSAAAAYAKACAEAGHPVEGWRTNSFCPMECPDSFVFNGCGKGCHATCADPNPSDCEDTCVEGCYCPPGTVLQDGECIESSDCKCLFEGEFLDNGQSYNDTINCKTCTCVDGGIIECTPKACPNCPAGTVPVSYVGSCCPFCVADWVDEKEDTVELTVNTGPATLQCVLHDDVLVGPDAITWKHKSGDVINMENKPDNFEFSDDMLTLTINPASLTDDNEYVMEVVYEGVVGGCLFDLIVNPVPPKNLIDLVGDSPVVVKEGECATLSVEVVESDSTFSAEDFKWDSGLVNTPIDFSSDKISLTNGGKSIKICDAADTDEGPYRVCVTEGDVTDCVDIELRVLIVCDDGETEKLEGEVWMEGEFTECTCTPTGDTECTCIEQEVECSETEEAYNDENCQLVCSRLPGNCEIEGDPHYTTFDGHKHDFQGGNCRFSLVKTSDFEIVGTNAHRDDNENVSWNDVVEIFFKTVKLYLGPEGVVKVDDKVVPLPYQKVFRGKKKESISVIKAGNSVVVQIMKANGLEALDLTWDGNSTVSSTIHGKYFEDTSGLCGSWDENPDNDQEGEEVNDWGWGTKYNDDVCETEPPKHHPCDDTWFPEAAPIADEACAILEAEPFTRCHGVIDPESAINNCKFDTCGCFDASCACTPIQNYAKACQEKGVTGLEAWRNTVEHCPMPCEEGLTYEPCGSFCPPTCGDKDPDCGKLAGKCNEGCFCPKDTYLQDGKCVPAEECQCMFNGEVKAFGDSWENPDTCQNCECQEKGEVICVSVICDKCSKKEQRVFDEGACCPRCVEDWVTADPAEYTDVPLSSDLTIRCSGLVPANTVDWFFSNDDGETWTEIDRDVNRMTYTIKKITAENDGLYKCVARKNRRTDDAVISVKTAEEAVTCTVPTLENGVTTPNKGQLEVGDSVQFKCKKGFRITVTKKGVCKPDGSISAVGVCKPVKKGKGK